MQVQLLRPPLLSFMNPNARRCKLLVLSRKAGQRIHIGDNIWIEVLRIKGNAVRIGVAAPKSVPIRRGELKSEVKTA